MPLQEHEKSFPFVQGMIIKHCRHLDYPRAAYWIAVAEMLKYKVPTFITRNVLGAAFKEPNAKELLLHVNQWVEK